MTELEIKTGEEITKYVRFLSFGEALRVAENQRWVSVDSLKTYLHKRVVHAQKLKKEYDSDAAYGRALECRELLGLLAEQKKEK